MDPRTISEFRELLEVERRRLTAELSAFASRDPKMRGDWDTAFPAAAPGGSSSAHSAQEEQADLREEFETTIAQEQSLESRLDAVVRALERINQNAFGSCRACGQPIPLERLKANPAAEYDMVHQPRE
jgi:RNA polymerase-binding transcription factor DksA